MCRLSWNLGASTSWNPQGLSRPVMGLPYLTLLCTFMSCFLTKWVILFRGTTCKIGPRRPHFWGFWIMHNFTRTHTHTRARAHTRAHTHTHARTRAHARTHTVGLLRTSDQLVTCHYLHNKKQETNIHAFSGVRTQNSNNQAATDLRLRPHGHRHRLPREITWVDCPALGR